MMASGDDKAWRNLTFSQRESKVPLPEALQAEKLTTKFRNQVWFVLKNSIDNGSVCDDVATYFKCNMIFNSDVEGEYWKTVYSHYLKTRWMLDGDDYLREREEVIEWLENLIVRDAEYEVLTLLESMLRFQNIPEYLADNIAECFKLVPYSIDRSDVPVCIVRTTSKEMKESIKRLLDNINQSELTTLIGAKSHLCNATQELNNNNFAAAIRESIHAVEGVTRQIAPSTSKDFSASLDSLEKNRTIKHPALEEAFNKLYAYISSETGIQRGLRHPLLVGDEDSVGFDEAIFMYGACVSFVDYLVSKKSQLEKNDTA